MIPPTLSTPDTPQARLALLRERLSVLEHTRLDITDESHLHAGHEGAKGGASHFRVCMVGPCFSGLSRVAAHRMVYHQVQDLIPSTIHALALDTKASE